MSRVEHGVAFDEIDDVAFSPYCSQKVFVWRSLCLCAALSLHVFMPSVQEVLRNSIFSKISSLKGEEKRLRQKRRSYLFWFSLVVF